MMFMSFSSDVKKELIQIQYDNDSYRAELAALIRMNGVISTNSGRVSLDVQTESAAIARRIYSLLKRANSGVIEVLVRKKMRLKKNNIYIVGVQEEVHERFT